MSKNYYEFADGVPVSRRVRRGKRKKNRIRVLVVMVLLVTAIAIAVPLIIPDDSAYIPQSSPKADEIFLQSDIQTEKGDYTTVKKTKEDIGEGDLILVNGEHAYDFREKPQLVSVYEHKNKAYKVKDKDLKLNENVITQMNKMMKRNYELHGDNSVNIISAYRTRAYQQKLMDDKVHETSEEEAQRWVAPAGYSEHHSGLAFDLGLCNDAGESAGFTGTDTTVWITENPQKYGFIVRYPEDKSDITGISYEPWHIRYVGIPHTLIMKQKNLCLEEYMDFIREYKFSKNHLNISDGETEYEVYFTKSLKVPVPKDRAYSISGNNTDGFIVAAKR